MSAGRISPLLLPASVDNELQRAAVEAEVVEQRAALGGCAVDSDPLAL